MNPSRHDAVRRTLTHVLLWAFALSWAFDFKADVAAGAQGGSLMQLGFLGISIASGLAVTALNWRRFAIRPGVWLWLLWWAFLGYIAIDSLLQGVPIGRFVRVVIPFVMIGLGLAVSHAAACRGLRPMQIATPLVVAGTINIAWRIFYGFAFKGASIETVRMEVFSSAMNPLIAYLGCAFFLRPRFHWTNIVVAVVTMSGVLMSVTRGLLFPMAAAVAFGVACFILGLGWRVFSTRQIPQKIAVIAGALVVAAATIFALQLISPLLIDRWASRLFFSPRAVTAVDVSWLTREAEATAMWKLVTMDPIHFITGRGLGAEYHWDPAFWPELYTVFPPDYDFSAPAWFIGHSVWSYTHFSGGVIGVAFHLAFFVAIFVSSLQSVRRTPGHPEAWLGFLPLFIVACLVSESITSNQFAERLAGVMLGLAAGIPQALLCAGAARRKRPQTWRFKVRESSRAMPAPPRPDLHPA